MLHQPLFRQNVLHYKKRCQAKKTLVPVRYPLLAWVYIMLSISLLLIAFGWYIWG